MTSIIVALIVSSDSDDGSVLYVGGAIVLFVLLPIIVGLLWRARDKKSSTSDEDRR